MLDVVNRPAPQSEVAPITRFARRVVGDAFTVSGRTSVAPRLLLFALAFALASCGADDSSAPTTTVSNALAGKALPATTEASPTTTEASPSCAELEQRKQDLEVQKRGIDERKKGTKDKAERDALKEQKKQVEAQKHAVDEQLRACHR